MLERAREKARRADLSIDFRVGDAEAVPLPDDSVDLVTARHLIWTLPDPSKAIDEWCRVVEPGGRIVLIEGHWDFPEPWDEYEEIHDDLPLYRGRPPEALADFIRRRGLERIEQESLMDPVLWGKAPDQEIHITAVTVPGET